MTQIFVSRHPGAIEWSLSTLPRARRVAHLDVEDICAGDEVFGTLPVDLAAEVCARGARFHALVFDREVQDRDALLDVRELELRNVRFEEYFVERRG